MLRENIVLQGRYRIIAQIGRGGMGAVYRAMDTRLHCIVALKQTLVTGDTHRRAFEREAQLLAGLRHPSLPRVSDHFNDEIGQFLVMEYIEGDDLATLLDRRQRPFPVDEVLPWADQLLDVLEFLHAHQPQVIHRDIKPQNIKLTDRGQIILLDFGLAKGASTQTITTSPGSVYGYTPHYAPLEQIQGTGTGPRSDLYALGATLYHLLTNVMPVDALSRSSAKVNDLPDPLTPIQTLNPQVPTVVADVVMQALAQKYDQRPAHATLMRTALRAANLPAATAPLPNRTAPLPDNTIRLSDNPQTIIQHATALLDQGAVDQAIAALSSLTPETLDEPGRAVYVRALQARADIRRRANDLPGALNDERTAQSISASTVLHTQIDQVRTENLVPPRPHSLPPDAPARPMLPARWPLAVGLVALLVALAGIGMAWGFGRPAEPITFLPTSASHTTSNMSTQTAVPSATPDSAQTAAAQTAVVQAASATAQADQQATAQADQQATAQANLAQTAQALAALATQIAPEAPAAQAALGDTTSAYAPEIDALLLSRVYQPNIVTIRGKHALKANQTDADNIALWARDLDYAISGYSNVLGNMDVLRESVELLLAGVRDDGVAPEALFQDRRGYIYGDTWDSMPNLIQAAYVYIAKTGDQDFYRRHRSELQRLGAWIAGLDSDGDGLPDRDDFPFGYYNSVTNSVRHTYALAKFYAAYNQLAELEALVGEDDASWRNRATSLRANFHRSFDAGGYWLPDQPWPIAWIAADGAPVTLLETFGVFEALHSGLIARADGPHYDQLIELLHTRLPDLLDGPTPLRLTLGGYDQAVRRPVNPPVPLWMLDASTPWIVGIAAPVYAAAGFPQDATRLMTAYRVMANAHDPPVLQFAAGPNARYGAGDSHERGVTLGSAAWFMAIYEGHYGFTITPAALLVQPRPFEPLASDQVTNFSYQGAAIQLVLDGAAKTYSIQASRPLRAILRPIGGAGHVRVDGAEPQEELALLMEPGHVYTVVSE